ncbi:hypothetical protein CLV63_14327 [Murinocardiopsis flavida]|uniref:Apea-like HEPN domain-containing protein n=1 Tax=Murinocardiopsis flavida TaxID=645275 RepID=A0A2P8CBD3_9ACTN|nr:hypothetical protein CLV63_14327 [Murinocardiopsis flavida]
MGQMTEEFWRASWVCLGAHLSTANERVLRSLTVALDSLYYLTDDGRFCTPTWARIEGVEHPGEEQEDGTLLTPYILPIIGGRRTGYASGSTTDTAYTIDTHATRPWISPATEAMPGLKLEFMMNRRRGGLEINLRVGAHARVEFTDASAGSAREMVQRLNPLLELMSLATFDSSGVEWIKAHTIDGAEVSLLCHIKHPSMPDRSAESSGVVFTFKDVSLSHFLETWQKLTSGEQAQYAWNMAVGLIGHSPLMVEEHVSQVLGAAEGFHRWCLRGKKEESLKNRLVLLHDRLTDELKRQLNLDVGHWAVWATWARNHVSHGGAEKHRDVGDFYQLKVIADSVRLVTYLNALQEFGVSEDKLVEALRQHPRLCILVERCAELAKLPTP